MVRDSNQVNLSFVFKDHLSKVVSRDYVNLGFCYVWAWIVRAHFPEAVLCNDRNSVHAFVRLNGLYFDSTRPIRGVKNWKDLRTYNGYHLLRPVDGPPLRMDSKTPREFYTYWNLGNEFRSKLKEVYRHSKDTVFKRRIRRFTQEHVEEIGW